MAMLPTPRRVKNKAPAPVQLTGEHLIREARELHGDGSVTVFPSKKRRIVDADELAEHGSSDAHGSRPSSGRGGCGDASSAWMRYARWEESPGGGGGDPARARSVYERALAGGAPAYRDHGVWIEYAHFEARGGRVGHARNVLDRAVAILPRADRIWLEYVRMEDLLGATDNARLLFDTDAWDAYAAFELRHGEVDCARAVHERHVAALPCADAFIRFAEFEMKLKNLDSARRVYEHAASLLAAGGDNDDTAVLLAAFADFEERCGEPDRARAIYQHALRGEPPEPRAEELREKLLSLEKRFGDRHGVEDSIVTKRRSQYERAVTTNPLCYDAWFDLIRLEESANAGDANRIRDLYRRAVANVPPAAEKRHWRRYIYLWINYALFEELDVEDVPRARDVYRECLRTIPHKKFSFSKIWVMAAELEIRDKNLAAARRLLGNAIGVAPRPKLFRRRYIYLWINYALFEELDVEDVPRARDVYRECLRTIPHKKFSFSKIWVMAAELEIRDKNLAAARRLLGNAIGVAPRPKLFRRYIEIELQLGNVGRCRILSQNYIEHAPSSSHAWRSYAALEKKLGETDRARSVYDLAVSQPALDAPELVWTDYIQFEIDAGELDRARQLYERLLGKTQHLNVWVSHAEFEATACSGGAAIAGNAAEKAERVRRCRAVFQRADEHFRGCADDPAMKEARAMLLQQWLAKEAAFGDLGEVEPVEKKTPRRVKRKRSLLANGNGGGGCEEFFDYIFGDEEDATEQLASN
uniref:Pre-mRNA-splicing factor Syf1/CRNKL1-like C-terminal HAT-repeats domain-containing protein n=1 Tax=Oryza meridionalis TaxID=40149 RepID=A0A0E0EWM3_9ORYZ